MGEPFFHAIKNAAFHSARCLISESRANEVDFFSCNAIKSGDLTNDGEINGFIITGR